MSPVGLPETPDRMKPDIIAQNLESWFEKKGLETFLWIWNDVHPSPFEFSRAAGIFSRKIIRSSLKRRLANMAD
jgi:hypothetical protein